MENKKSKKPKAISTNQTETNSFLSNKLPESLKTKINRLAKSGLFVKNYNLDFSQVEIYLLQMTELFKLNSWELLHVALFLDIIYKPKRIEEPRIINVECLLNVVCYTKVKCSDEGIEIVGEILKKNPNRSHMIKKEYEDEFNKLKDHGYDFRVLRKSNAKYKQLNEDIYPDYNQMMETMLLENGFGYNIDKTKKKKSKPCSQSIEKSTYFKLDETQSESTSSNIVKSNSTKEGSQNEEVTTIDCHKNGGNAIQLQPKINVDDFFDFSKKSSLASRNSYVSMEID